MKNEFDLENWDTVRWRLKSMYPQLTDSDLIWRHETKDNLYNLIARKLLISKKEFTDLVDSF
jgi:hypothetical protein